MKAEEVYYLPFDDTVVDRTMKNVVKKYDNTDKSLMYERTPVELLDNLIMGDIAKNSLIFYLRECGIDNIIDYDDVRTDNFLNADPGWDFLVGQRKVKVEVKSSIPPNNESISDIVSKRDIKITAALDKDNPVIIFPKDLESHLHIQIYFYASPYKDGYDSFDELSRDINSDYIKIATIIGIEKYSQPLFLGWNTKDEVVKYTNGDIKNHTWTFPWTKRLYWDCPIRNAHNLESLVRYCKTHANQV